MTTGRFRHLPVVGDSGLTGISRTSGMSAGALLDLSAG